MSPKGMKVRGWVVIVCGSLLAGMMGWLSVWFAWVLWDQQRNPQATTSFTGGPVMAALVMGLFLLLFAFGAAMVRGGIYMIRRGQRDARMLQWIPVVMGVVYGFWILMQVWDWLMG